MELKQFARPIKLTVFLPTQSKYYEPKMVETNLDGSVSVMAMTARDELMLKSPDALLNGETLIQIIHSAVPAVRSVKNLTIPDVETLILAVLGASYGNELEIKVTCPACSHENHHGVDINYLLANQSTVQPEQDVVYYQPDEHTKLRFDLQPYTFECNVRQQLAIFEQSKLMQFASEADIQDVDKLQQFNASFEKIVACRFQNVAASIRKISIFQLINSEWTLQLTETNKEKIADFIENATSEIMNPVIAAIDKLNSVGIQKNIDLTCQSCGHAWNNILEYNPANFFVKSSSAQTNKSQ